ncbi:hypothetical protein GQ55_2G284300 [Panicum hallii var. hallii]|uniref:Uncharacterized protein n=1 Tax=Panicum hallii var. hallii TaxID=1504633 RepID=A0A2T7ET99_9POAL|nr:hypothetical protein GQ55_2G284300 [Panicum hallii var. hallii]
MEHQSGNHIKKPLGEPWLYPPILSLDLFLLAFHEVTREGPLSSCHFKLVLSHLNPICLHAEISSPCLEQQQTFCVSCTSKRRSYAYVS